MSWCLYGNTHNRLPIVCQWGWVWGVLHANLQCDSNSIKLRMYNLINQYIWSTHENDSIFTLMILNVWVLVWEINVQTLPEYLNQGSSISCFNPLNPYHRMVWYLALTHWIPTILCHASCSKLFHVMAWGAKPLLVPVKSYCQLELKGRISIKFKSKHKYFD